MDYEKRYKELAGKMKKAYLYAQTDSTKAVLEDILPELAESEDERIRKEIMQLIQGMHNADPRKERWLSWLEKQGETFTKKDVDDAYLKGVCDAKNELEKQDEQTVWTDNDYDKVKSIEYLLHELDNHNFDDWFNSLIPPYKEKEAESVDKVEPKFKVGDWVVNKGHSYLIADIDYSEQRYLFEIGGYTHEQLNWEYIELADKKYHLWTIQDAKDGDVVVNKSDGTIGIFESIGHHPDGGSYNDPSYCFLHCRYDDGFFYADFENGNTMDADDLIPATKEQRDLLFAKMKEAGYEWDAAKKQLEKIIDEKQIKKNLQDNSFRRMFEQKPVWSEEDEERLQSCINILQAKGIMGVTETINTKWLKSLKDRYTWKPSDKQLDALHDAAVYVDKSMFPYPKGILMKLYKQLKKLKGE